MAKTFKASKLQILIKIVIPANLSTFINSLKVNIGLSLVGVISGEFLVSKAGLRLFNCLWRASVQIRFGYGKCNNFRYGSWYHVCSSIIIRKIYPTFKKIQIGETEEMGTLSTSPCPLCNSIKRRRNFEEKSYRNYRDNHSRYGI